MYAVDSEPLKEVDIWLERFRQFWNQRLDALAAELVRGRPKQREQRNDTTDTPSDGKHPSTKSEEDK